MLANVHQVKWCEWSVVQQYLSAMNVMLSTLYHNCSLMYWCVSCVTTQAAKYTLHFSQAAHSLTIIRYVFEVIVFTLSFGLSIHCCANQWNFFSLVWFIVYTLMIFWDSIHILFCPTSPGLFENNNWTFT